MCESIFKERNIMLKYTLAASAAVAAIMALSAPSYADSNNTSATITVNGNVGAHCSMALHTTAVDLPADITGDDGKLNGAALALNPLAGGGEFWCNAAGSKLTLNATPFTNTGFTGSTVPDGFTKSVNYTLSGSLGDASISYDTADHNGQNVDYTVGIFDTTEPTGSVQADPESRRLIAGAYQAVLTLTLTPGA
jgi:hypothetical protein